MESYRPLVSVIIPAFNHGPFIADAIGSALNQTYGNVEVVVVDNCSTDNTADILARCDDRRVRAFQFSRHNIGAVRNFGAAQSKGKLLAFLDADDQWMPDKLEEQWRHLADPGLRCVGTDFVPIGDKQYYKRRVEIGRKPQYRDYGHEDIACNNPVLLSSALLRADDFWEVNGFDECDEFMYIEDWALWLRLARRGRVRVLRKPLIAYRVFRYKDRDRRAVAFAVLKLLDQQPKMAPGTARAAYGSAYLDIGKACLKQNDGRALGFLCQALRQAVGLQNIVRAIGGILLCTAPKSLRGLLIDIYYRIPVGR